MDRLAFLIIIIGALNWAMYGWFGIDVFASMFGGATAIGSKVLYSIVGLAGLWCISILFREDAIVTLKAKHDKR